MHSVSLIALKPTRTDLNITCHTFAGKEQFSATIQMVKSPFIPNDFSAEKGTKSIKTYAPSFEQKNETRGLKVTKPLIKMKGRGLLFLSLSSLLVSKLI